MSRTLSTHDVAAPRRLAFWTDMVCDTYVQLQCDAPAGSDVIDGEIVSDELATLQLSRVTATAQFVRRTPALIARASEDHFLVSIQTKGRGVVSQDGRDAVLGPETSRCTTARGPTSSPSTATSSSSCSSFPARRCARPCATRSG
jgi:hypothetical protein